MLYAIQETQWFNNNSCNMQYMKHNSVTKFMQNAIHETQWCSNNLCKMQCMKHNGLTIIYAICNT